MKPTLLLFLAIALFGALIWTGQSPSKAQVTDLKPPTSQRDMNFATLIDTARHAGTVHVIVGLRAPFVPEGDLDPSFHGQQRRGIKQTQSDLLSRLPNSVRNVKHFDYIPYMAMEVNEAALTSMRSDASVLGIEEDVIGQPGLAESTALVNTQAAWAAGYTGAGQTVAIVDSGVDKNHTFLSGRVVSEGCYSSNNASSTSVCPGAVTESTAANSGLNCATGISGCDHGTHVAGIAAGRGASFSGVAKDANIVAVQVFSSFGVSNCGSTPAPCALYWTSDLIKGIERVRTLKASIPSLAAVNLSLQTGQQFTGNCDAAHAATKAAIDNLRTLGVATVICSGNFAFTNALTAPACISSSISVGSIDDGSNGTTADVVSSFSDSSPLLHLLAPGRWVNSSIPGNAFANFQGTSMATPHVTGAFAVLRQRAPGASVGRILKALTITGQPITDSRNGIVKPRINVAAAVNAVTRTTPADFDDDGKTDVGIFRPSNGEWWIYRSLTGTVFAGQFGASTDKIVPADYTGDGRADIAIFRPSNGDWFVLRSEDLSYYGFPFGTNGDIPISADFDGDGKSDPGVFRPSDGTWYIVKSTGGTISYQFGTNGDKPVPADYDGDGLADVAIYRPSVGQWWLSRTTAGVIAYSFGLPSDKPTQGDYTGDGKADVAFWRGPEWFILRSEDTTYFSAVFGALGDLAAPGDYDGDGKNDPAVFRPSTGTWFVNRSSGGTSAQGFGANGDQPIPGAYVPFPLP
jgi:subtilisin